jgi:hypothetical protein
MTLGCAGSQVNSVNLESIDVGLVAGTLLLHMYGSPLIVREGRRARFRPSLRPGPRRQPAGLTAPEAVGRLPRHLTGVVHG